jgi:FkbM family methyltransferase
MNPNLRHVVLFEPQAKYQRQLCELSLPGVDKILYQCGLGERRQTLAIRGGTASASFLDSDQQSDIFPGSFDGDKEELVEVYSLDSIYQRDQLPVPELVKLDVQGFELSVLQGGVELIRRVKYLVVELSFRPFYKGQPSAWQLLKFLDENNFVMVGQGYIATSWAHPKEMVQFDAIFRNTMPG